MSLQSYEAIYDHGQVKWLGDRPQVEQARVIVTTLPDKDFAATPFKHQPSALSINLLRESPAKAKYSATLLRS